MSKRLRTSFFALLMVVLPPAWSADIALIIDDMGNTRNDAKAFELPVEVAFSILPNKKLSGPFSAKAAKQQREVMLHVPMESLTGKALGPGALTSDMHPDTIHETLSQALATVPNAIGINNHMGSKLTQLTLPMEATMDFLQQHQMFFVDSRTTRFSKAQRIADQKGVQNTKRNVFLDHIPEPQHINQQFQRLVKVAKKYGQAVGIAHPYPQTMAYLKQKLPELNEQGVRLVPLSDILHTIEFAGVKQPVDASEASLE